MKNQYTFILNKIRVFIVVICCCLIEIGCSDEVIKGKQVQMIHSSWKAYTLESAIESANTVVYGTVTAKSDTKTHEVAALPDEKVLYEYYQSVDIEVIDSIKGDPTLDVIEYKEMGGEGEDEIQVFVEEPELTIGDTVLVFLNEHGAILSPITVMWVDENGIIDVYEEMIPKSFGGTLSDGGQAEIPVEEYCDELRKLVE